jgi:hypothetical protein
MPFYHKLGNIPHKRHVQFPKPDGGLYHEQVMGTKGFSGIQSILYHVHAPTEVKAIEPLGELRVNYADFGALRHRHFKLRAAPQAGDALTGRMPVFGNADIVMSIARPVESMPYFYRNAEGYEMFFVHEGSGALHSTSAGCPRAGRLHRDSGRHDLAHGSGRPRQPLPGGRDALAARSRRNATATSTANCSKIRPTASATSASHVDWRRTRRWATSRCA